MNDILPIHSLPRRLARGLASACVMGVLSMACISTASAQSTTGAVVGKAPAGDSITVHSDATGASRTVTVDANGRYSAPNIPLGTYTVTLAQDGQAIAKHLHVPVSVGRSSKVDFTCGEIKCDETAGTK